MDVAIELVKGAALAVGRGRVRRGEVDVGATCHVHLPGLSTMVVGRSDGSVSVWRPRNEFTTEVSHFALGGHRGAVTDAVFVPGLGVRGLLFTASADSTVRVWDPFAGGTPSPAVGGPPPLAASKAAPPPARLLRRRRRLRRARAGRRSAPSAAAAASASDGSESESDGGGGGGKDKAAGGGGGKDGASDDDAADAPGDGERTAAVQTLSGRHSGAVTALAYARGALLSAGNDGTVRVWTCAGERSAAMLYPWFQESQTLSGFGDAWVTCLGVRDGTLFAGDSSGHVHVFQRPSSSSPYAPVRRDRLHSLGVSSLHLVAQQNYLVTVSFDCTFKVHDLLSGQGIYGAESVNRARYTAAAYHSGMDLLALGDTRGYLQLWSVAGECVLVNRRVARSAVARLSIDGDSVRVAAGETVTAWTVRQQPKLQQFRAHAGAVVALELQPDGNLLSASADGTLRCFDPFDMACLSFIEVRGRAEVTCMCVRGAQAYTGHSDGSLSAWSTDSGARTAMEGGHADLVTAVAAASDGWHDYVLSVSYDGALAVWEDGGLVCALPVSEGSELLAVAWDPVRQVALAGGNSGAVHAWNVTGNRGAAGSFGGVPGESDEPVTALAVDAHLVFVGREDGSVSAHEAGLGFCVATTRRHASAVRALLVLPGGHVASCSADGHVAVWNYAAGEVAQEFSHPGRRFLCLAYDAGGAAGRLYVAAEDGSIVLLDLAADALPGLHRAAGDETGLLERVPAWEKVAAEGAAAAAGAAGAGPKLDFTVRLPLDGLHGEALARAASNEASRGGADEAAEPTTPPPPALAAASSLPASLARSTRSQSVTSTKAARREGSAAATKPPPSPRSTLRRALTVKDVLSPREMRSRVRSTVARP